MTTWGIPRLLLLLFIAGLLTTQTAWGQVDYERPPIDYLEAPVHDCASQLQKKMDAGKVELTFDKEFGYLKSLLQALDIPQSSQVLVFSKTSFQQSRISPRRPRALYFNDDTYVGWVQRGDVIEISSVDAQQGAEFYTLNQLQTERPHFDRQTHNCLICHGSSHTGGVPGHFVRSVVPDRGGQPVLSAGTYRTDFTSPLAERWGGWYVTGTHGAQRHMGNVFVKDKDHPEQLDMDAGANVTELKPLLDVTPYLTPHSDIVALMVLEHQVAVHNVITAANYSARITQRDAQIMNKALERDAGFESDSTQRRYATAAEKVVDALLMVGEYRLTDAVTGTSSFSQEFQQRGPFDRQRRSLRDLDLRTRLFKYPCSYLIYSAAFDALPSAVRDRALRQLWLVLTSADTSEKFQHLSRDDRQSIREILCDTKPHLPDYWMQGAARH